MMIRKFLAGTALGLGVMVSGASAEGLNIAFISHSSASNTFWQSVKKGYDDACEKVGASCQ
jgi:simple sugar transport system substrate-binding protein